MEMPENVILALREGRKIEAIRLLREATGLGLNESKEQVERWMRQHRTEPGFGGSPPPPSAARSGGGRGWILWVLCLIAFVWAFVNIITPLSALIVLSHLEGYRATSFRIESIDYYDNHDSGLYWGFQGHVPEEQTRLYAPDLADARALGLKGLRELFPPGSDLRVWYNPAVTDTLFQARTLRVIPYAEDLKASELRRIYRWLIYCLMPLVLALFLSRRFRPASGRSGHCPEAPPRG